MYVFKIPYDESQSEIGAWKFCNHVEIINLQYVPWLWYLAITSKLNYYVSVLWTTTLYCFIII